MQKFEFIKYDPLPEDSHTNALVTIRYNLYDEKGKPDPQILVYGCRQTKSGGVFYPMASHGVTQNGEKKYVKGQMCDSRASQDALDAFVAECFKRKSAPSQASVYDKPTSMDEVSQDGLPF